MKNAGYKPANTPIIIGSISKKIIPPVVNKEVNSISFPANVLNHPNDNFTIPKPMINDKKAMSVDSVKNCPISDFFPVPKTFLIPTSLALPDERAVVRFMKLMHANTRINNAAAENIYTY